MFYLVNNETAAANSLMMKMAKEAKPGALIACTKEEMDSFNNGDFIPVAITPPESKLIEADPDKTYMLFADNEMNIDDARAFINGKKMNIGIVRVDK